MSFRFLRINWHFLFLHFLSVPLFILGARQLALIPYARILQLYQQGGIKAIQESNQSHRVTSEFISGLIASPLYAWFLAILASCALSALVVWHRRESKLLPVALFVLAIVTSWTHYYESKAALKGMAFLRWPLEAWPLATRLGIVGPVLLMIGCLPFLLTWQRPVREQK